MFTWLYERPTIAAMLSVGILVALWTSKVFLAIKIIITLVWLALFIWSMRLKRKGRNRDQR
jgi:hypothetical protein